jgi:hypothetical protein
VVVVGWVYEEAETEGGEKEKEEKIESLGRCE